MSVENLLQGIKSTFHFMLKAPFVLKILKFTPWLFGHAVRKLLDKEEKVNFNIHILSIRQWNFVS